MARNVLIGAVLLFCCRSTAAAQTVDCRSIADTARISEVGAFSNMRYTVEHAYGYSIMLWRAGDCLLGFLESSEGLAGDTPIGALEHLEFDSKTGRLAFSAKLTMGVVSARGSRDFAPSRDLFVFEGHLKGDAVSGVMTHTLQNDLSLRPTRTNVVLKASQADAEFMHGSQTYGEWLRKWQSILQLRGPKWS